MPESPESVPAIVVTGATGNVGRAVVHALLQSGLAVRALVTDPASATLDAALPANGLAFFVRFDFADPATFNSAFNGAKRLFLMRPPAIGNAAIIINVLDAARIRGVNRVAFLSIQGAEHNPLVPHHAIEKQLMRMAAEYASEMKSLYQQGMAVPRSLTRATSGRPSPLRSRMQTVVPTPIARLN